MTIAFYAMIGAAVLMGLFGFTIKATRTPKTAPTQQTMPLDTKRSNVAVDRKAEKLATGTSFKQRTTSVNNQPNLYPELGGIENPGCNVITTSIAGPAVLPGPNNNSNNNSNSKNVRSVSFVNPGYEGEVPDAVPSPVYDKGSAAAVVEVESPVDVHRPPTTTPPPSYDDYLNFPKPGNPAP